MNRNTKNMAKGAALGVMAGTAVGAIGAYAAQKSPKEWKKTMKKAAHTAEKALDSSLAALGYGHDACTFVVPGDLDQQALFVLIEGLDPICIVAADGKSAALLGQAYHLAVPSGKATRPLGRTAVSFLDFESLLKTPQDKQIAWALLKKLPRFGDKRS